MAHRTLTLRLIAASAVWLVLTLCTAGLLLLLLFQDHIERRFDAALADHLEELTAASEVGADGALRLSWQPFDPRFNRPQSGWYWQIERGGEVVARSDSLWPARLQVGPARAADRVQELTGPGREALRATVTPITLPRAADGFVYTIAGPVADVREDVAEFGAKLALTLLALALGLLGAVVAQVHYGLRPLQHLRRALADVRSGAAARLPERFPGEVQPLVHELNGLLDHNQALLERARTQTGNLAHALKNPLTVIRSGRPPSPDRPVPCSASRPTSWVGRSSGISPGRGPRERTASSAHGRMSPRSCATWHSRSSASTASARSRSRSGTSRAWYSRAMLRTSRRCLAISWTTRASGPPPGCG